MTGARGILRVIAAASLPSASIQVASSLRPTSRNTVARATPVHSLVLVNPCVCWAVCPRASRHSPALLPAHSMKASRETAGKRFRSSMGKGLGRRHSHQRRGRGQEFPSVQCNTLRRPRGFLVVRRVSARLALWFRHSLFFHVRLTPHVYENRTSTVP